MPGFRHPLALKIVLPFAALTLAIGAVGTLTATGELSTRSQEAFDNQLIHDGFVAQSMVKAGDTERRAILRLLTGGARPPPALGQTPPAPGAVPPGPPHSPPRILSAACPPPRRTPR